MLQFLLRRRRSLLHPKTVIPLALALFLLYRAFLYDAGDSFTCPELNPANADLSVPNVVHFIHFDAPSLHFVSFVCVLAAFYNQRPDKIVFHTNLRPTELLTRQDRWRKLVAVIGSDRLELREAKKPTHVYGQPVGNVYHANDVLKIRLALEEGGIFLDQDTFIVRSLKPLLRGHEVTLGWPEGEFIGIQCILARPNSTFVRLWQRSYKDYRPTMWYYNAGEYPTGHILGRCPHLVRREDLFGVSNLAGKLYEENHWAGWKDYYSIHLLFRHRSYLAAGDVKNSKILDFDEHNILGYNRTFGEMARSVLTLMEKDLSEMKESDEES